MFRYLNVHIYLLFQGKQGLPGPPGGPGFKVRHTGFISGMPGKNDRM